VLTTAWANAGCFVLGMGSGGSPREGVQLGFRQRWTCMRRTKKDGQKAVWQLEWLLAGTSNGATKKRLPAS
jgi:hypothetical protein